LGHCNCLKAGAEEFLTKPVDRAEMSTVTKMKVSAACGPIDRV
jgi:FixJ family two-component response regulator